MKKYFLLLVAPALFISLNASAQYTGSFVVGGDLGKYYPVVFQDAAWYGNRETEFDLGRSGVHTDADWRGSLIAKFRIHTYLWGNGSNFIDATIRQFNPVNTNAFIAGWTDGTINNGNTLVIIWLQGGSTTYYWTSAVNISPAVYDGVANPLPYQVTNGPALTYKTSIDNYVNSNGVNSGGTAYFTGTGTDNYFAGYVGIGTKDPDQLLTVNGTIHAKQVTVDLNVPAPDYVFDKRYHLRSLSEVKAYVEQNHHLPGIKPADAMQKDGMNVGELNIKLLQKVEELTLYLIEKDKNEKEQQVQINAQKMQLSEQNIKLSEQQEINKSLQEQINWLSKQIGKQQ